MMRQVITIYNQKGGVGKTTLAVNLVHGLARLGKSVTLVDLANPPYCHKWFGIPADGSALRWMKGEDVPGYGTRLGMYVLPGYWPDASDLFDGKELHLGAEDIRRERFEALQTEMIVVDGYRYEAIVEKELLRCSDLVLIPHTSGTPLESSQSVLRMCSELCQEGWAGQRYLIGIVETLGDIQKLLEIGKDADGLMLVTWNERLRKRSTVFEPPRVVRAISEYHNLAMWVVSQGERKI